MLVETGKIALEVEVPESFVQDIIERCHKYLCDKYRVGEAAISVQMKDPQTCELQVGCSWFGFMHVTPIELLDHLRREGYWLFECCGRSDIRTTLYHPDLVRVEWPELPYSIKGEDKNKKKATPTKLTLTHRSRLTGVPIGMRLYEIWHIDYDEHIAVYKECGYGIKEGGTTSRSESVPIQWTKTGDPKIREQDRGTKDSGN